MGLGWVYSVLILIGILWGGSFSAIKHLLDVFTPSELILVRFFPAAMIFAVICVLFYRNETYKMLKENFWNVLAVGLFGIPGYHYCLNYGETKISAGLASLIIGLNPSLTFILASLIIKEKPNLTKLLGVAISFLGLFILIRYGSGQEISYNYLMAALVTVLSPTCWAFYTVTSKPLTKKYPPLAVASLTTVLGTLPAFVFFNTSITDKVLTMGSSHIFSLAYLSIIATVLGNIIWMTGVKKISATMVSSFSFLSPLSAVFIGIIFLGESLNLAIILGGLMILGGVWVTNKKFNKK